MFLKHEGNILLIIWENSQMINKLINVQIVEYLIVVFSVAIMYTNIHAILLATNSQN